MNFLPKTDENKFKKKHRKNCEKLPWELLGRQGVKVFLLKDVIITTLVTTVFFITITIWVFELSQFNFFKCCTIWVFELGYNLICQVLSQFVVLSFVTVWVLEYCHNLGFALQKLHYKICVKKFELQNLSDKIWVTKF